MTAPPAQQPHNHLRSGSKSDIILERLVGILAWGSQAATASVYITVSILAPAWRTLPTFPFVLLMLGGALMVFLWGMGLYTEQTVFYDRAKARLFRQCALIGQGGLLVVAAVAPLSLPNPDRLGIWGILGMGVLTSTMTWEAWMRLQYLPPEDQAVIDAITRREAQVRAAAYDASQQEKRRNRLNAIVGSLGYELAEPAVDTPAEEPPAPDSAWDIPARKHDPLVYFIRNGNRLKIGTTTELKRRIRTLALRPENVALLVDGGQQMERAFHRQFADLRIGSTEWFAYEGILADFITTQNQARKDKDK